MERGISANGLPIPVAPGIGIEYIGGVDSDWQGVNISFNFDAKLWFEGHGEFSYTWMLYLKGELAEKAQKYIENKLKKAINLLPDKVKEEIRQRLGISIDKWNELTGKDDKQQDEINKEQQDEINKPEPITYDFINYNMFNQYKPSVYKNGSSGEGSPLSPPGDYGPPGPPQSKETMVC